MYYEKLTPREQEVFDRLVINGLTMPEISKELYMSVATVKTHINDICNKFAFRGQSRINQLIIWYWLLVIKGVEKMKNCTKCKFDIDNKCECKQAEDYQELVNEYMICREFKEKPKKKCYSPYMADCVEGLCEGCRYAQP